MSPGDSNETRYNVMVSFNLPKNYDYKENNIWCEKENESHTSVVWTKSNGKYLYLFQCFFEVPSECSLVILEHHPVDLEKLIGKRIE